MQPLPEALYDAAGSRALDRLAQDELRLPDGALMQRAGEAAFTLTRHRWPRARRIALVCGPGNNGGDGYVLARWLHAAGLSPRVVAVGEGSSKGDAAAARAAFEGSGAPVEPFGRQILRDCEVVVDALFGTGLEREVEGEARAAIEAMNDCGRPVLALDLPSGLHADSGRILGVAVKADATLSFVALKAGQFTGCGPEHCGEIFYHSLGVPPALGARIAAPARRLTRAALHGVLARRPRHLHKGEAGRVLVIGGQPGMAGAARLAGEAAYRAGAGLVTVLTHPQHAASLNGARPELIVAAVAHGQEARAFFPQARVIAVGPGLGQGAWGGELWQAARATGLPLVVDADALRLLAADPERRADWVLTPHPGEASRLLGCSTAEVQHDRYAAARAIATRYGGVCVLKGCGTLIVQDAADGISVCDRGHPGMASGGVGDVLTGIIAGLLAQGLAPPDAARLAVWAHAGAGDAVAARQGEIGLLASDLFDFLPAELRRVTGA